ncbi:MAG: uridine kinase [Bdellovibrionales bacterium]|nr:uridine kinase [Bdellovibrionales bacterium]
MIGIAGGSGSGKTTFAKLLTERLGRHKVTLLGQDNYYIDQSDKFDRDGGRVNFDHPDSIDWPLLAQHLKLLKMGHAVDMPLYDLSTHVRRSETVRVEPSEYILLDGILIFVPEVVRVHIDYKVFIQTPEEVRFARRLKRDIAERGRTEVGVRAQYFTQVKPMHDQFVEPSLTCADKIISGEIDFSTALDAVVKDLGLK